MRKVKFKRLSNFTEIIQLFLGVLVSWDLNLGTHSHSTIRLLICSAMEMKIEIIKIQSSEKMKNLAHDICKTHSRVRMILKHKKAIM